MDIYLYKKKNKDFDIFNERQLEKKNNNKVKIHHDNYRVTMVIIVVG
jgi:hypothetical protein